MVFDSIASNLVAKSPGQGNDGKSIFQVYRKDLTTGEIVCCSVRPDGEVGNWDSRFLIRLNPIGSAYPRGPS